MREVEVCILCLIVMVSGSAFSSTDAAADKFTDMTLTIAYDNHNYIPMEPIEIHVTLQNNTSMPIEAHPHLACGYSYLEFQMRPAAGEFSLFDANPRNIEDFEPIEKVFEPHESISNSEVLSFRWLSRAEHKGEYIFPESGKYSIMATLKDLKGKAKIQSNVLEVDVVEPEGVDALALEYLRSKKDRVDFLLNLALPYPATPNNNTGEIIGEIEEFVNLYSKSTYAKHAEYALGVYYKRGVGQGRVKAPEMTKKDASQTRTKTTGIEFRVVPKLPARKADDGWTYKEGLSEPEWSPDSKWIAFTRDLHKYMKKYKNWHGKSEVWIVSPDGSNLRKLTEGVKMFWHQSDVLAYAYHTREKEKTIARFALINVETSEITQLQEKPEFPKIQFEWKDTSYSIVDAKDYNARLADQGRREFYKHFQKQAQEHGGLWGNIDVRRGILLCHRSRIMADGGSGEDILHLTSPDLSEAKVIVENASAPALSHDGQNIAFVRDGELWIKKLNIMRAIDDMNELALPEDPNNVDSSGLPIQLNRLLAEADANIRSGLVELSKEFPYMTRAKDWERMTFNISKPGTIYIQLSHANQRKGRGAIPIPEIYGILVVVTPPTSELIKHDISPLYRNLGLVGQVNTSAQNVELRLALNKLVGDALAPIELLNGTKRLQYDHQN